MIRYKKQKGLFYRIKKNRIKRDYGREMMYNKRKKVLKEFKKEFSDAIWFGKNLSSNNK